MRVCFPILAVSPGVGLAVVLTGCAPAPPQPRIVMVPAAASVPVDVTPGFDDREPDTCKAATFQALIGQPAGNLRTVPVQGPVRIITPGQVVDQDEYLSNRINAHINGDAQIIRLSCG